MSFPGQSYEMEVKMLRTLNCTLMLYLSKCQSTSRSDVLQRWTLLLHTGVKNGLTSTVSGGSDDGDGCYVNVVQRPNSMEMATMGTTGKPPKAEKPRRNTSGAKLEAKKRVIRMLVVIVVLFFLCWMPLYCANTWRAFDEVSAKDALSGAPISFIHLLCYTSACVNPIIYCFMNTRFRKALISTFSCCAAPCKRHNRRGLRDNEEDVMTTGASMSKFSYTTVSTMGTCWDGCRHNQKETVTMATQNLTFFVFMPILCWPVKWLTECKNMPQSVEL